MCGCSWLVVRGISIRKMMFDIMPTICEDRVSNIGTDMADDEDEVWFVICCIINWMIIKITVHTFLLITLYY